MKDGASRLVVVFGGGNGIGAASCRTLAEHNWRVAVVDLDPAAAAAVAKEVGGSGYGLNVTDLPGIERVCDEIEKEHGPVYGLVVSSGAFQERCGPTELTQEIWDRVLNVNIVGTFNVCQVFGTRMAKRGAGSIVTIASTSGHTPTPVYAYSSSKAAVLNFSKSLAVTWARSGVRVNSLSPGHVMVERKKKANRPGRYAPDMLNHIAMGRQIEPEEIAEGVEFLISDRASAITGIDLLIDAGLIPGGTYEFFGGIPPALSGDDKAG